MGAVLEQQGEDGEWHPVMFWSKTLKPAERNYSGPERECLAVVQAIKQFRHYVYGSQFTVYTDHNALKWLQTVKEPTGRLQRWILALQEYNFEIKYRRGTENATGAELDRVSRSDWLITCRALD